MEATVEGSRRVLHLPPRARHLQVKLQAPVPLQLHHRVVQGQQHLPRLPENIEGSNAPDILPGVQEEGEGDIDGGFDQVVSGKQEQLRCYVPRMRREF